MASRPDDEQEDSARSYVEHNRHQQRREAYWDRQEEIRTTVRRCSRALERGDGQHYQYVAYECLDTLLPTLLPNGDISRYHDALADRPPWHPGALRILRDNGETVLATLRASGAVQLAGGRSPVQVVVDAFHSLACIAEAEEIIREELRSRVDAVGFTAKVGEHLQDAEMDIGDPVRVVTERSGALKTLFTGGTGQGKSAALETEAEDYYLRNFEPGRDFKLVDIVGLRDGENWFYDIPQNDEDLQDVRADLSLPESFEAMDVDGDDRQIQLLVPLTPGIEAENLPFDTDDDRFVVEPFTVPACDIRKPLLVSMIVTKLTPQQETIVRTAYDDVSRAQTDWTLADLADEIRSRDDLGPDKKKPVIGTLRQLQEHGFIRTREDDYTINWREIFTDNETVTVFSQAFMDDVIAKLIVFGYLAHTVVKQREQMHGVPECVVLMRELWKVAPHNQRQEFDNRAAALQEAIGQMLAKLFRENRHSGVHVLADTQQPSDLLKPVREMFNRYVIFNTNKDTTKDIFEWTSNDKWRSFYATLTPKPGEASVVGMVEPAVEERDIEFLGPIQYAAPSHHHRMELVDTTGWNARVKYHDHEELRRPTDVGVDWDAEVPTKLKIDGGAQGDDTPDVDTEPVAAFVDRCVEYESHTKVRRDDLKAAFNAFVYDYGRSTWDMTDQSISIQFGKRLKAALDDETGVTTKDGHRAYKHIHLNEVGQEYVTAADETFANPLAPMDTEDA